MNHYTQEELESIFADDFSSPTFPVLANIYYKKKEYKRALKVCEIGLSYVPNNYIGQFILSKVHLINQQYIKAEKLLKIVVFNNPHHSQAVINLVKVQFFLKRSKKNIQKNIDLGISIGINHELFIDQQKNSKREKPIAQSQQKSNFNIMNSDNIRINKDMATKTMYKIMLKQKKHDIALSILQTMNKQSKYKRFVSTEIKKNRILLNKEN